MMRIAIAGTNGFAQYLCHYLQEQTPHQFMLLSRRPNAGLAAKGWQVVQTSYDTFDDLAYLLIGVDVVISTIAGAAQLVLIDAAAAAHVRTFVPSEFRSVPCKRAKTDVTDDERLAALTKLEQLQSQKRMQFTVFACGVFYERFAPGGLAASQIDVKCALGKEGDFISDVRKCHATLPFTERTAKRQTSIEEPHICMTSSRDAARYVIAALELQSWPKEFRFRTERLSLRDVVAICERVRGTPFQIETQTSLSLNDIVAFARHSGNSEAEVRASQHLAAFEGSFDFADPNLEKYVSITCERFEDWLRDTWRPVLASPPTTTSA